MTRSSLLSLPNEILSIIIRLTVPGGIESFTATCKLVRELGSEILRQHLIRRRHFSGPVFPASPKLNLGRSEAVDPLALLVKICEDPGIAVYPQHLRLMDDENGVDDLSKYNVEEEIKPVKSQLESVVSSCPFLLRGERAWWAAHLLYGCRYTASALLILLLPNLKVIHFGDSYLECRSLAAIVDRISKSSFRPSSLAFLQHVYLNMNYFWDPEIPYSRTDGDLLQSLIKLPSVRILKVEALWSSEVQWPLLSTGCSSIEGIQLYDTEANLYFIKTLIKTLIAAAKKLRTFALQAKAEWEPWEIVDALHMRARDSLEQLKLTHFRLHETDPDPNIVDVPFSGNSSGVYDELKGSIKLLQSFTVLRELEIASSMLWMLVPNDLTAWRMEQETGNIMQHLPGDLSADPTTPQMLPLIHFLPASIESVMVRGPMTTRAAAQLLSGLRARAAEKFPNIEIVNFGYTGLSQVKRWALRKEVKLALDPAHKLRGREWQFDPDLE
ncbi:MAG: hypothetical protein Q9190_004058, partial [Brigantiaea leucoxantha]